MIRYFNEDCMVGMARYPDNHFDLAIVDPPYRRIDENDGNKEMRKYGKQRKQIVGDKPGADYFMELFRVSKNQIIWGANNFQLPNYKGFVVWEKLSISELFTMSMAELAYISEGLGTTSKIFKHAPQGSKKSPRIHPTQKPVALYKWLLTHYAKPGDKILDTHVGSASSLIACFDMGFDADGYELDPEYYAMSKQRLNDWMRQQQLLGGV